jgi:cyclophilin family peptidyl-prolyl cis-trans isomerase
MIMSLFRLFALTVVLMSQGLFAQTNSSVGPVPPEVRQKWELDGFYQKYLTAGPLPIVSSTNTTDYALREAQFIVRQLLGGRPDILAALAERRARVAVMAYNEYTTDLPEQHDMKPKAYWDSRARGLGGQVCSCAEENLLCFPGDPYSTENIFIHEFAHVIHGEAMAKLDPTFDVRLTAAYTNAMARGLWKGTYAAVNVAEYWAESVQDWFDNNRRNDALHNNISTRIELQEYDPPVAKLCREVFGDNPWRYKKPLDRDAAGCAHLAGYSFSKSPTFRWREVPLIDKPQVRLETALGNIEVELYYKQAPTTVSNFLRYAHERLFNDGQFFRTVTLSNQPTNTVKIQVIQAEADLTKEKEFYPPIPLERTRDTGLKHLDGTLSMARNGPDTAQASFSICIGDQPELDFGGKRNPDGQGFAAFGRVTKGMELVRKIHAGVAEGQALTPPVRIQRAVRLE